MRKSELLSVKFNDAKRNRHMFYINSKGKHDKWRRIPLIEKAIRLINRLQTLMSIEEIEPPYIAFNTKKTGNVMTYKALRLIKHRAVEFVAAGNINRPIDAVILTYTTILLANCNLLIEVIQLVGHESVNTTNGYFQRLNHISNILNKDLPFP